MEGLLTIQASESYTFSVSIYVDHSAKAPRQKTTKLYVLKDLRV